MVDYGALQWLYIVVTGYRGLRGMTQITADYHPCTRLLARPCACTDGPDWLMHWLLALG